jgi:hypothetical protein
MSNEGHRPGVRQGIREKKPRALRQRHAAPVAGARSNSTNILTLKKLPSNQRISGMAGMDGDGGFFF